MLVIMTADKQLLCVFTTVLTRTLWTQLWTVSLKMEVAILSNASRVPTV
eukprot:COSAG02_NODE_3534_length_6598_cov_2.728112_3_plen_49_part_00